MAASFLPGGDPSSLALPGPVSKPSLAQDFCRPHPPLSDYETFWPQPSQVVIPLHEQQYFQKAVYSTTYQAILADSKQRNFKD